MWRLKYCTSEHIHETDSERADVWLLGVGGEVGVGKAGSLGLAEANHDI